MALCKWRVQFTATLACIVWAFTLGDQCAVDNPPLIDEVRPKVVIHGHEFFVLEHYPKNASGRLQYDKKLIEELDTKTTDMLRNMCKHNPPPAQRAASHKAGSQPLQVMKQWWTLKVTSVTEHHLLWS